MSRCIGCGGEATHKVWESLLLHKAGMPPKYVGCTNCGEMRGYK